MPTRHRSAEDPPKRTPSFVCEMPLRVSPAQERTLLARLEAARQVRVTCLGEARKRVRLVRESKAYQHARTLPRDDPARPACFRKARAQHDFSEYALHAYAQPFGYTWLGEHLDSLTIQTLATRAYRAANQLLLGKARLACGIVAGQCPGMLVGSGLAHQPRASARLAKTGDADLAGRLQAGE